MELGAGLIVGIWILPIEGEARRDRDLEADVGIKPSHRRDRGETPVIEGEIGTALSHQVKLAQFGRSTNRLSL